MSDSVIREEDLPNTLKHYEETGETIDPKYLVETTSGRVYLATYLANYKAFSTPNFDGAKFIYLDEIVKAVQLEEVLPLLKEFKRCNS